MTNRLTGFYIKQCRLSLIPLCLNAWQPEEVAIVNSTLPTVLDKVIMVENINVRKLIVELSNRLKQEILKTFELRISFHKAITIIGMNPQVKQEGLNPTPRVRKRFTQHKWLRIISNLTSKLVSPILRIYLHNLY